MSRQLKHRLRTVLGLILGASFLGACGIKGDLKRPDPIFDKSSNGVVSNP